ncbi:MAG: hypothetical protein WC545_03280 [Patescibacteria group bacterium]
MFKNIIKIIFIGLTWSIASLFAVFILWPRAFIDISIIDDTAVFVCWKFIPRCQEVSGTSSYKFDLNWSPDGKYLSFYDDLKESDNRFSFLKIVNPLTRSVKIVFIGPEGTGYSQWLDNDTIRTYGRGGTGVTSYCDININYQEPFVLEDRYGDSNCKFIQLWLDDLNWSRAYSGEN